MDLDVDRSQALRVYWRAEQRYRVRMGQLSSYFELLIRLAYRAEGERLNDLFDRIELTMTVIEQRRALPLKV